MAKTLPPLHRPPVQDGTGWRCVCHRCHYGEAGFMTKRGARRAIIHHLEQEHPPEDA